MQVQCAIMRARATRIVALQEPEIIQIVLNSLLCRERLFPYYAPDLLPLCGDDSTMEKAQILSRQKKVPRRQLLPCFAHRW